MKRRNFVMVFLALLVLLNPLTGCASLKHGATLYSTANEWIDESFLAQNRVSGAYYTNEKYTDPHGSEPKYIKYPGEPKTRTFIISNREEYDKIFTASPIRVDFEKKMVILHTCADVSLREYNIKELVVSDKALTVKVKQVYKDVNDSVEPYQRCFMLVMQRTEISEVKFEEIRR